MKSLVAETARDFFRNTGKKRIRGNIKMAVHSEYLSRLTQKERDSLIKDLWERQNHKCFVSGKEIDLDLHKDSVDIDHVIALSKGGADEPSNFALELSSSNRSKSSKDLNFARCLYVFKNLAEEIQKERNEAPNLEDVLNIYNGAKYELSYKLDNDFIKFTYSEMGKTEIVSLPVYTDSLSGVRYFFVSIPIEYIFHDEIINPRKINSSLPKLMEEFYNGYPQLQVSLGYITGTSGKSKVMIFDGQHKAAAQILLNIRDLPVRVFINPDTKKLIDTNLHAGTTLKQVAFDKSVISGLGSLVYKQHITQYQEIKKLNADDFSFSEADLLSVFTAEKNQLKKYIVDDVKEFVNSSPENKLMDFVEMGGRSSDKPLSYSTLDKILYNQFINKTPLIKPLNYKKEDEKNPRDLEKKQLIRLMNILADKLLLGGKFDKSIGTAKIEDKVRKSINEKTPLAINWDHIRACRMFEEVCFKNWIKYIDTIIKIYFMNVYGREPNANSFQEDLSEQLWINIENYIENLSNLPFWKNAALTKTVFGIGKPTDEFWNDIFTTGETSQGVKVLSEPINVTKMITKPAF